MEAVAAGYEVTAEFVLGAVFSIADLGLIAREIVNAYVFYLKKYFAAGRDACVV